MHLLTPPWAIVNQPGSLNQHRVLHLLIGDMWVIKTEHVQVQVQVQEEQSRKEQEDSLSELWLYLLGKQQHLNFPVHTILVEASLKYYSEKVKCPLTAP